MNRSLNYKIDPRVNSKIPCDPKITNSNSPLAYNTYIPFPLSWWEKTRTDMMINRSLLPFPFFSLNEKN